MLRTSIANRMTRSVCRSMVWHQLRQSRRKPGEFSGVCSPIKLCVSHAYTTQKILSWTTQLHYSKIKSHFALFPFYSFVRRKRTLFWVAKRLTHCRAFPCGALAGSFRISNVCMCACARACVHFIVMCIAMNSNNPSTNFCRHFSYLEQARQPCMFTTPWLIACICVWYICQCACIINVCMQVTYNNGFRYRHMCKAYAPYMYNITAHKHTYTHKHTHAHIHAHS